MDTKIRVHRAPKTLITGNGCVAQIGDEAKKLRTERVLIITDPGVACCGTADSAGAGIRARTCHSNGQCGLEWPRRACAFGSGTAPARRSSPARESPFTRCRCGTAGR